MPAQQVLLESVQKLLRRDAGKNITRILQRTRSEDIAVLLRSVSPNDQRRIFLLVADQEVQAEVLAEADPEIQEHLVEAVDDHALMELLSLVSGDDAADILELLDEVRATAILAQWKSEDAADVDALMGYRPDSAGGIMSPDVFALPESTTVAQALATLQTNHEDLEMVFYLYVVNDHGHLVGVCSLRELVISGPDVTLGSIMTTEVVSVQVDTDQEEVARFVARYNLLAVPVLDATNRLVGVVTVDDVIDVIREEATEDMLMMAGAGGGDFSEQQSALRNVRLRMPWLLASFCGGIASMFIIAGFATSLERVAALAAFIPITLGMGGNVGTQSATVMTRGIALGRINVSSFGRVVVREVGTGALLGVVYGLLLGVVVALLYGNEPLGFAVWHLSMTVGISILACMTIAATVGGVVPILFHRVGIDPAIATGPFVTTGVDVVGITTYFVVASLLLPL